MIAYVATNTKASGLFGLQTSLRRQIGAWLSNSAVLLATASLCACTSVLPPGPKAQAVYDFGPAPTSTATGDHAARKPALAVADVEAVSALEGNALLYRLGYVNAQQLQPYTQARWAMPPAQLLRQRLLALLASSRTVLSAGEATGALLLQLQLDEFSHYFDSPTQSKALLRLRATLHSANGQVLAQQSFTAEAAAPSGDSAGAAAALAQASDTVLALVLAWLPP